MREIVLVVLVDSGWAAIMHDTPDTGKNGSSAVRPIEIPRIKQRGPVLLLLLQKADKILSQDAHEVFLNVPNEIKPSPIQLQFRSKRL